MRRLTLALAASLLTACAQPIAQPTAPAAAEPSPVASAAPVATAPAALKEACRVSIDGVEAPVYQKTSKVLLSGAGIEGRLAISTPSTVEDRAYTVNIDLKALGAPKGLAKDFKPADINRIEFKLAQFALGKSRGNGWSKVVDVPSSAVKVDLKHDGDHLAGSFEVKLDPDSANEAAAAKPVTLRFEFDNTISY